MPPSSLLGEFSLTHRRGQGGAEHFKGWTWGWSLKPHLSQAESGQHHPQMPSSHHLLPHISPPLVGGMLAEADAACWARI